MHRADLMAAEPRALRARRSALAALLLVLVVVAGLGGAAPPSPRPSQVLDELHLAGDAVDAGPAAAANEAPPVASIDELRARVAAVLEREGVAGVGLALVDRSGVRWAGGVGVADLETRRPVDADTQFRVASITKSVVALGVMRLVDEGRLDLATPLATLMPEVAVDNQWDAAAPITLAHALEHSAGFDDMRFNEWFGAEGMAPGEALTINPRSRVARWRPGSRMSYSNPGYTIAGHAIEGATGRSYEEYLEREILGPLGMRSARFRRTPEFADRLATGYSGRDRPAVFQPISHAPAGALLASPRELGGLVHFWLVRGEGLPAIVSPAGLDRIERTETLPYRSTDTNYGLGNYGDVLHRARARGHDGGLPGFLSAYRYFPELGVGYVMLLNGTHSARAYLEIRALLFATLTRDLALPAPPTAPPNPAEIAAASGYYGLENPRNQLFAFLERATVGVKVGADPEGARLDLLTGGAVRLVPTGDGGYRHPIEGGTSIRLTTAADGTRLLVGGMRYFEEGSLVAARSRLYALQAALFLLQIAPFWGIAWGLRAGVARRRGLRPARGELALHAWPALCGLLFVGMVVLLGEIGAREAFTSANPLSITFCAGTLAFAAASAIAVAEAVRAHVRGALPWSSRITPSAIATAAFGMTLYLLFHGIIGLRLWAW